jgi:hypothetical protein
MGVHLTSIYPMSVYLVRGLMREGGRRYPEDAAKPHLPNRGLRS